MNFEGALRFLTDKNIQRIAQDPHRTVHQKAADIAALHDPDFDEVETKKVKRTRQIKPVPDVQAATDEGSN